MLKEVFIIKESHEDYFSQDYYLDDRPKEISPSGKWLETTPVKFEQLPPGVQASFKKIQDAIHQEEQSSGEYNEDQQWSDRIDFASVGGGAQDVWEMGMHMSNAPFNPSGHDFFCRGDGTYLGYTES